MNARSLAIAAALGLGGCCGCYTTQIDTARTGGEVRTAPAEYEHHQFFTLAGAVSLSEPVGDECARTGVATATSEAAPLDVLLEIGLTVGSAYVATVACKSEDPAARASCIGLSAPLGPLLLGSRTVRYRCVRRSPKEAK